MLFDSAFFVRCCCTFLPLSLAHHSINFASFGEQFHLAKEKKNSIIAIIVLFHFIFISALAKVLCLTEAPYLRLNDMEKLFCSMKMREEKRRFCGWHSVWSLLVDAFCRMQQIHFYAWIITIRFRLSLSHRLMHNSRFGSSFICRVCIELCDVDVE